MILADSDALIDFLRGRQPLGGRVSREIAGHNLVISVVSVFELMAGVQQDRDRAAVDALLARLPSLRLEAPGASFAGLIDQDLRRQGQQIAAADMLIAGIALQYDLSVLTKTFVISAGSLAFDWSPTCLDLGTLPAALHVATPKATVGPGGASEA